MTLAQPTSVFQYHVRTLQVSFNCHKKSPGLEDVQAIDDQMKDFNAEQLEAANVLLTVVTSEGSK